MKRTLLIGILIYSLILIGMADFNHVLLALAMLLIVYLGAGLIFSPEPIQLQTKREISPERVSPGSLVDIKLTIKNKGSHLEELLLEDKLPPQLEVVTGVTSLLTEIGENEKVEISYQVRGNRGIYYFEGVQATANDRFDLFRRSNLTPAQGSIFIMPQISKIRRVAIRPRQTRVYSGSVPARLGGPGVEFFGVREYRSGDSLQRINWRASARHAEALFSNEFVQERVTDVGLILDARERSDIRTPGGTLFEYQITATAALTDTLINDGNRVGLLVYGNFLDWTYPRYGKVQRERIFQALARAQTGDSLVFEKLENLPAQMFPSHSQLILFSPLLDDDVPILIKLRARGYQVMVISPNPIDFQRRSMPIIRETELGARLANIERKLLFNELRQAGIIVLDWDVSVPFGQAMQSALSRLWMWSHPFLGRLR